jgi:hypothetical protein
VPESSTLKSPGIRGSLRYGPDADEPRALLRTLLKARLDEIWPADGRAPSLDIADVHSAETIATQVQALAPQTDEQRWLRGRAANLIETALEAR